MRRTEPDLPPIPPILTPETLRGHAALLAAFEHPYEDALADALLERVERLQILQLRSPLRFDDYAALRLDRASDALRDDEDLWEAQQQLRQLAEFPPLSPGAARP